MSVGVMWTATYSLGEAMRRRRAVKVLCAAVAVIAERSAAA